MRKLLAALLGVSLLFPIIVTPVAAASSQGCETGFVQSRQMNYRLNPPSSGYIRGIKSRTWSQARIQACAPFGLENNSATTYWVAIVPAPGNEHHGSANAILQIGVIKCRNPYNGPCTGSNGGTPRLFIARGGCNQHLPFPDDIGPAPDGSIDFEIHRNSGGSWTLSYFKSGWGSGFVTIQGNDERTSCWASGANDYTAGLVACERVDGGDGCGDVGAKVTFETVRIQRSTGGGWYTPGNSTGGVPAMSDGGCWDNEPEFHCDTTAADRVQFWTIQG